ncbi:Uncharacterized conserved protein [uncultured Clostridium sp.]|nr:Uncharacterized conserved protein [uncultured Clostridium sp.]
MGTMLDKVSLDDIPESFRELAEIIGIDAFKKLVINYGGTSMYVPVKESISRSVRDKILKDTFDGNYKKSASTYRISESHVRRILKNT